MALEAHRLGEWWAHGCCSRLLPACCCCCRVNSDATVVSVPLPPCSVVERFNGVTFDLSFGFRALLDSHPISTVCLVFWSTVLCQAYALRVFERPVCISAVAELIGWCGAGTLGTKDFNQFAVAVWNALITALTIGYGDVFAVTHAGRAIAIMCGISGVIFVALLVNAMSRATALKADERRAFEALQRHHLAVERRKLASDLIKAFYTYVLHKRGVRTMVDLFKRRSVSLATANALSGSPSRDSTSVTTNPLRSGLGVRPHLALHLSTSTSTPNAAGNHPVPHLIMRHLVLVLGRWRRHQRIWHETTRDKDDLDIVKRDVIEVSTRLTELSMHTAAEIDRLTRHIKAQGLQLETVAAGMPGMLSQMRALSDALKVPVTHQMAASSASVDFAAGAAHQSLAPSSDGLDDTVDVAAYEKKHREAALLRRRASMPGGRGSIRPLSPATSESSRSARPLASFGSSAGAVAVGGGGPAPIAGIGVSCTCNCHKVPIGRGKRVAV